jgi:hypothetical protein
VDVNEFIDIWSKAELKERSGSQEHFLNLCALLGHDTPAKVDPKGNTFTFERALKQSNGQQGFADVWKRGYFAWEYKGKHADLNKAYEQLEKYRIDLENPPLMIVSDMASFEIHTNFSGTPKKVYRFALEDLRDERTLKLLEHAFYDPDKLNPKYYREAVTEDISKGIAKLTRTLQNREHAPQKIAHFFMQFVFACFAEDVGLLENKLLTQVLEKLQDNPAKAMKAFAELFEKMATGGEMWGEEVAYFNGGLFEPAGYDIPLLYEDELATLLEVAKHDWTQVEPAIFGTLFERSLDPSKRSQLGAHYTSVQDIMRIVRPVIIEPLEREWVATRQAVEAYTPQKRDSKATIEANTKKPVADFLSKLHSLRVLDPACGSGNFLYAALQQLKELEKQVIIFAQDLDMPALPLLSPKQFYGLEKNVFAHELASIVVWIGYLQWNHLNGVSNRQTPVLEKLNNIRLQDALMDEDGNEAEWPQAEFIVGNPPFLGNHKMREELSDNYINMLYKQYKERLPNMADFVCYWFEKTRANIEQGKTQRAGLIATHSIRGGANRRVLERIKDTGDIFMAWSDEPWVLDGAAVRVSIVGFDDGSEKKKVLDGNTVSTITPLLTSSVDVSTARKLIDNANQSFEGVSPKGKFDLDVELAQRWMSASNPDGVDNSAVLKPYFNAKNIVQGTPYRFIVDFTGLSLAEAKEYVLPFELVKKQVKPARDKVKMKSRRENWWLFGSPATKMRNKISQLNRYLATPNVSKHHILVWLPGESIPSNLLIVIACEDDYTFGILHSRIHGEWALAMGTSLGPTPRYTPSTCFETFPFPEPTEDQHANISKWAKYLDDTRQGLLDSDDKLTMTKLYNQLTDLRTSRDSSHPVYPLLVAHDRLDAAVAEAYGWEWELDKDTVLERLLALNLERAGG